MFSVLLVAFFFLLQLSKSNQCFQYVPRYGVICWSMGNLPMGTPSKRMILHLASTTNCQWHLSKEWVLENTSPIYFRAQAGFIFLGTVQALMGVWSSGVRQPCHSQKTARTAFLSILSRLHLSISSSSVIPEWWCRRGGYYRCPIEGWTFSLLSSTRWTIRHFSIDYCPLWKDS